MSDRKETGARPSTPIASGSATDLTIHQYLDIFHRRKLSLVLVFLTLMALSAVYVLTRPKIYESVAILVVVNGSQASSGKNGASDILGNLSALTQARNVDTQVEILKSPELLHQAFALLSPKAKSEGFHLDLTRKDTDIPKWGYKIENTLGTDTITITTQAYQPDIAAELGHDIAATYLKRDLNRGNQATAQARVYVEHELEKSQSELANALQRRATFKKRTKILAPEVELQEATTRLFELREENEQAQSRLRSAIETAQARHDQLSLSEPTVQSMTTVEENPEFAQVTAAIESLEAERAKSSQEYKPDDVIMVQLEGEISSERARLAKIAKNIVSQSVRDINPNYVTTLSAYSEEIALVAGLRVEARSAAAALREAVKQLQSYPAAERTLAQLQETVDELQKTHANLSERFYELSINEKSSLANGFVASEPESSPDPVYPKVSQTLALACVFSLIASFAFILGVERLDTRVHDPDTAEKITGLPILAAIPETVRGSEDRPLIGSIPQGHGFLEGFRILRNNIAFSMPGQPKGLLAVTSAGRAEGKSTTAINLAIAMAMDGKKVLIVDVDLRRPSIHTTLGISREVGLTSVVTGHTTLEAAVQHTGTENLDALCCGPLPPNPTEFLNSARTRDVFKQAQDGYDVVIADCPPCSGLSDVQVVSTIVDAIVLVVSLDATRKPQLLGTMQTLWQANAPILGLVLNRVDIRRSGYGYYYYYYYSYEEGSGDKGRKGRKGRKGQQRRAADATSKKS